MLARVGEFFFFIYLGDGACVHLSAGLDQSREVGAEFLCGEAELVRGDARRHGAPHLERGRAVEVQSLYVHVSGKMFSLLVCLSIVFIIIIIIIN